MPKCDVCGSTVAPGKYEVINYEGKDYTVCIKDAPKVKADPASYLK